MSKKLFEIFLDMLYDAFSDYDNESGGGNE